MFSRGTKTNLAAAVSRTSGSPDANPHASLRSKFASGRLAAPLPTLPTPPWLRDGSSVKQLPGIYQGVLGQVQLQPALVSDSNKFHSGLDKLLSAKQRHGQAADYMERFTDTERVHQLLSTSRLSNETLAAIWAHVNKTFPGQLTNREVCLALALIAIFQCSDGEQQSDGTTTAAKDRDPFHLVRLDKKPPVPKLYPNAMGAHGASSMPHIPSSNSVPNELSSSGLLIDIASDEGCPRSASKQNYLTASSELVASNNNNNNNYAISLIDMDSAGDEFEVNLARQTQVWLRFMLSMKSLFKRSFDILNVENCRPSALEALATPKGVSFCKQLSVCYPLAHNIAFRVEELWRHLKSTVSISGPTRRLLDEGYTERIADLMVSINEYWAVLINLFHECGPKEFIELIMDGVNQTQSGASSWTCSPELEKLKEEFTPDGRRNICSICLTKFYLVNIGDALEGTAHWAEEDVELVFDTKLITQDECFYYHPKCANFWLNNVPHSEGKLPFQNESHRDLNILQPTNSVKSD